MKYWYGLLGFVGVAAVLGVGVLVVWPVSRPVTTSQVAITTSLKPKVVTSIVSTNTIASPATTLTFVGDIMLDRYVRTTIQKNSPLWPFEKIQDELIGDFVIGNLEGPITENASVATNTNLVFTFDPKHIAGLVDAGFTHFSLANNHTLNFGQVGLDQTRTTLTRNDLQYFGDPKNREGFLITTEVHGQQIALIGYHGLVSGREAVIGEIKTAQAANSLVIVMPHWGNEYQLSPSTKQTADAHAFVEAGADLIIGAHPHVVQPIEVYQGKMIFYSLGNFLFDQYFSDQTEQGLLVRFTIDEAVISAHLVPMIVTAGQVQILTPVKRDTLLSSLAKNSTVSAELKNSILSGRFTLPLLP